MTHPIEQAADAVERELADLRAKLAVAVEALDIQSRWVRSSLDCPAFPWDCDQRYVAELQYKEARAALAQIKGDERWVMQNWLGSCAAGLTA